MTSTKEQPGPFDGLERAAPGEPVFTLCAHDPHAAPLVHEWVRQRRERIAAADLSEAKRTIELLQATEAEEIAWSMADWRNGQAAVPAPVEIAQPQRYSGSTMGADELAAKARYDSLVHACRLMRNAAAEVSEAADILHSLGFAPVNLRAAVDGINRVADAQQPKRASYAFRS